MKNFIRQHMLKLKNILLRITTNKQLLIILLIIILLLPIIFGFCGIIIINFHSGWFYIYFILAAILIFSIIYYSKLNKIESYLDILKSSIRFLEIVIVWFTIYMTFIQLRDIVEGTTFSLNMILMLMVFIGLAYTLLVIKENETKEESQKIELNRITILIYLMIFFFSLFAGIVVFKNNQPLDIIPKLPKGTVGL
jgi:MFS family permease